MANEDEPSGIRNFSVGFGASPSGARPALRPAPTYRLLIAGDFGIPEEGERHLFAGDIMELLREARPSIDVAAENLLGSHPATISQTIRIEGLGDLRPASLLCQFDHHRGAAEAVEHGDGRSIEEAGQRYDKLAAILAKGGKAATQTPSGTASAETGGDEGLDSLLGMIANTTRRSTPESTPADLISSFISKNVTPSRATERKLPGDAAALLGAQALAFLSHPRLRQVLENWHGLRTLLDAVGKERAIEITILQVAAGSSAGAAHDALAGNDGAMHEELFDVLLFANRCAATSAGAEMLKALAEAADSFDVVVLTTLEPDFARVPAEQLAAMDAPHQTLAGAGFEAFNGLRAQGLAKRLGVFWNDVLAVEGSENSPELYVPAAWLATAMSLRNVARSGWPGFGASAGNELSGFPVATRILRGRQVAVATRTLATDESAAGLASAGIATLNGRIDRDSVHFARLPLFSATKKVDVAATAPNLNDQLVLARIGQLLQSVLPEILGERSAAADKADSLERRFMELAESIPESPRFAVKAAADEEGKPILDIAVSLPEGVAAQGRFDFQIPC